MSCYDDYYNDWPMNKETFTTPDTWIKLDNHSTGDKYHAIKNNFSFWFNYWAVFGMFADAPCTHVTNSLHPHLGFLKC